MSVHKRSNGMFTVRWRPHGTKGKQESRDFPTKREAEDFDALQKVNKRLGRLGPLAGGTMKMPEYAQRWFVDFAEGNLALKTRLDYAELWDRHLLKRVQGLTLAQMRPGVIVKLRQDLERDGVGDATIAKGLGLLQAMFREAVLWELVEANPVKGVAKHKGGGRKATFGLAPIYVELLRGELLNGGRRRDALMVCLLAYAGLRPGEMLALEWSNVLKNTLVIEQAVSLAEIKATKNERNRSVDLLDPLRRDLDEYRMATGRQSRGLTFPCPARDAVGRRNARAGKVWSDTDWRNWRSREFKPALKAIEIPRVTRPYDLRHAFASLLLHEGKSLAEVADQIGDTVQTTSDTYVHVIRELRGEPKRSAAKLIMDARTRVSEEGVRKVFAEMKATGVG